MLSVRRTQAVHPQISYPLAVDGVDIHHPQPYRPVSPPKTPPRVRRPSMNLSNPMSWLGRTSSSEKAAGPHLASKPVRISEPQLNNALDLVITPRYGALGSGAIVVRTPRDAMMSTDSVDDAIPLLPLDNRALPPLPLTYSPKKQPQLPLSLNSASPIEPKPSRPIPDAPVSPDNTTVLISGDSASSTLSVCSQTCLPPVPALPTHLAAAGAQPMLDPIVIAPLAVPFIDRGAVIVTLETSTMSQRTTLSTLTARPSHLSRWFEAYIPRDPSIFGDDDDASVYSEPEHNALRSVLQKRMNTSVSTMHIFLDRPSPPYAHILSYLRSPVMEGKPVLPRSAQLTTSSSSRVDALIELRDEAAYLGLQELVQLCTEELVTRHRPRLNIRTTSRPASTVSHSRTRSDDSVRSLNTITQVTLPESTMTPAPVPASSNFKPAHVPITPISTTDTTSRTSLPAVASTASLYELYNHSPFTPQFPAPTIPPTTNISRPITPTTRMGLHQRMASRTRNDSHDFGSMKVRPAAQWI